MGLHLSIPTRTPVSERIPAEVRLKLAMKQLSQGLAGSYRPIVQIVLPECLARMVMDYAIDPIGIFIGLTDLCTFKVNFPRTHRDIPIRFSFFEKGNGDELEIVLCYGQLYPWKFELDRIELAQAIDSGDIILIFQKNLTNLVNVLIDDEVSQRNIRECAEEAIGHLDENFIKEFMRMSKSLLSK